MNVDLKDQLLSISEITNLVGQRVFFHVPQDTTYPLVRMQQIGGDHHHHTEGAAGLAQALMQIDCIGRLVADAKSVAEQVRLALQGWSGTQGSTTFQSVLLLDQRDLNEPDNQGGETGHYAVSMDFMVSYVESVPSF